MANAFLGIDIAKRKFDLALLRDGKVRSKVCSNTPQGCQEMIQWLQRQGVDQVHACLEATGPFSEPVALALIEAGHVVSMVNPLSIKGFAKGELLRTKTDKVDAALIARYCEAMSPAAWEPPAAELRELQALIRLLDDLLDMHQQAANRLSAALSAGAVQETWQDVLQDLDGQIAQVEQAIRDHIDRHPGLKSKHDLLTSIPGIGERTAARILGEILRFASYDTPRQLIAYCGLSPRHHASGDWVHARPRLSKLGNGRVRKAIYFPAVTAAKSNPVLKHFYERLVASGKPKMVALVAVMRKLLCLAFAVVKSGRPFDPNYIPTAP